MRRHKWKIGTKFWQNFLPGALPQRPRFDGLSWFAHPCWMQDTQFQPGMQVLSSKIFYSLALGEISLQGQNQEFRQVNQIQKIFLQSQFLKVRTKNFPANGLAGRYGLFMGHGWPSKAQQEWYNLLHPLLQTVRKTDFSSGLPRLNILSTFGQKSLTGIPDFS